MNWYKTAQVEKKPYRIYKVQGGQPDILLRTEVIYAISSEQARFMALKKYPQLRGFVDGCRERRQECDIEARIDQNRSEEIARYQAVMKEKEQKQVEEAWWNK